MSDEQELAAGIVMAGAAGKIDLEAMGAMLSVLGGGPIVRPVRDKATGEQVMSATTDATGKPLVAGGVYMLDSKRVKVLREEFGAGNALDTYYRVFYLDSEFNERFVVANVRYRGGPFGERSYGTRLEPVPTESAR